MNHALGDSITILGILLFFILSLCGIHFSALGWGIALVWFLHYRNEREQREQKEAEEIFRSL